MIRAILVALGLILSPAVLGDDSPKDPAKKEVKK